MAPLKTPTTLVTSIPNEGDEGQTIDIGGEKVPVMTQADLDKVLDHKVPVSVEGVNGEASVSKDVAIQTICTEWRGSRGANGDSA